MIYEIGFKYDKEQETIKTLLNDDKNNQLIITLSIYTIKGKYYINIYDDFKNYEIGRLITKDTDLFKHIKNKYREFPEVELLALSTNELGEELDFSYLSASRGIHNLYIIDNN